MYIQVNRHIGASDTCRCILCTTCVCDVTYQWPSALLYHVSLNPRTSYSLPELTTSQACAAFLHSITYNRIPEINILYSLL